MKSNDCQPTLPSHLSVALFAMAAVCLIGPAHVWGQAENAGKVFFVGRLPTCDTEAGFCRVNLGGTSPERISQLHGGYFVVDLARRRVYWGNRGGVSSTAFDGTDSRSIVQGGASGPDYFAVDSSAGKLYTVVYDGGRFRLRRVNLDGTQEETLVPSVGILGSIVLDSERGAIYWASRSLSNQVVEYEIYQATLNGSGMVRLAVEQGEITFLRVDSIHQKLYWVGGQYPRKVVRRSDLQGRNIQTVLQIELAQVVWGMDLDPFEQKLYVRQLIAPVGSPQNLLLRANLDGSGLETVWSCPTLAPRDESGVLQVIPEARYLNGGCCFNNYGCVDLLAAQCEQAGGLAQSPGTICAVNSCPIGACCMTDRSCVEAMSGQDCLAVGGLYQGDEAPCQSVVCLPLPTGACCVPTGACFALLDIECSMIPGGRFGGPGTECGELDGRSVCPEGVCCLVEGQCDANLSLGECVDARGTFQPGVLTCEEVICPLPVGACCLGTGSCLDALEADCGQFQGSLWAGPLTACNDNGGVLTCPVGACCLPRGDCAGGTTSADCAAQGGQFQAQTAFCNQVSCPQPNGACCLPSGNCIAILRSDCSIIPGASWAGPLTTCVDSDGSGQADACEAAPRGDLNGDGDVTPADISPFTAVLLGMPQAPEHVARADVNGDGAANGRDVGAFVGVIVAGR